MRSSANTIPDAAGHLLTASLMNAPAAIVMAKVMIPGPREIDPEVAEIPRSGDKSAMDAIARGTVEGAGLLINVIAMLVVLVALVHLANAAIGLVPDVAGAPLSLQRVLGWIMALLVWLAGIPWSEAVTAGGLMGIKTVLNELLAYVELAAPAGSAVRTFPPHHELRDLRLRQSWQSRNFGRRARHHRARAPRGNRRPRHAFDSRGDAPHLVDRRRRRDCLLSREELRREKIFRRKR